MCMHRRLNVALHSAVSKQQFLHCDTKTHIFSQPRTSSADVLSVVRGLKEAGLWDSKVAQPLSSIAMDIHQRTVPLLKACCIA